MRNHYTFVLVAALVSLSANLAKGQDTTAVVQDTSYWNVGGKALANFTQSAYTNWQAGGENAIALSSLLNLFADYEKGRFSWRNALDLTYGFADLEDQGFRKTDDRIEVTTDFAYQIRASKPRILWNTSASLLTQFDDGFDYPNDSVTISGFMAPGYLIVKTGLEIRRLDFLSIVYSPIATKITFVNDPTLSANGAYGVDPGENKRAEIGTNLRIRFKKDVFKNVNYSTKLQLFTNYVRDFGNIDVNWENLVVLKVNEILSTNLIFQLVYDDDVKIPQFDESGLQTSKGPQVQLKQIFGLGLSVDF